MPVLIKNFLTVFGNRPFGVQCEIGFNATRLAFQVMSVSGTGPDRSGPGIWRPMLPDSGRATASSQQLNRPLAKPFAFDMFYRPYLPDRPAMRQTLSRRAFGLGGLTIVVAPFGRAVQAQSDVPVIAAASDLQFALTEIAAAFSSATGMAVDLSFGSTGNLARQIRAGAPFQIFLAADEQFILDLFKDGYSQDTGVRYGTGRIVLLVPNGSALVADASLDGLETALTAGTIRHFAIANPDHAPYGLRAREALQHRGLWEAIKPHLVLGENVSQTAQFVLSGNADGGIIAYSLALLPQVAGQGTFALIPQDWHRPLRQSMVLLKGAGQVARAFYAFMTQDQARAILRRFGFAGPVA